MADSERESLEQFVNKLREQRDELRLKLHLAKADAKDEWEELESKWRHIEPKLEALGHEAKESASDIGAALGEVAHEIAGAYKRLRKTLR